MTQFCFVGDLHFEALDKYYDKATNPNRFIFEQLDKVIAYCKKAGIKNIFQLGDVFDHPYPDQRSIKDFLQFLHKHNDLNFYIIAGNHDYSNVKTTSLEVGTFLSESNLLTNIKIYSKAQHEVVEGVNIFFASYPVYQKFDYLKGTPTLCLGHFEVKGAKHDSGQVIKTGIPAEDLQEEDYWVLGHLHRHQNITPKVFYPGTMLQYNFGEPLPKGFSVSEVRHVGNQLDVKHTYIKLDTPYVLENVDINNQEDFDKLQYNDPKYYYKLFIEGSDIIMPQKLLNGSVKNVYKIIYSKSNGSKRTLEEGLSLSETFSEDSDKEKLFEPLGGLEDHLTTEGFSQDDISYALRRVEELRLEFNPKRS